MTWKLSVLFFKLRRLLGKWIIPKQDLTGEMLFFAKIQGKDYEGKSPADIKIFFDKTLDPKQCQYLAQEVAGTFLAYSTQMESKKKAQEPQQEVEPEEVTQIKKKVKKIKQEAETRRSQVKKDKVKKKPAKKIVKKTKKAQRRKK